MHTALNKPDRQGYFCACVQETEIGVESSGKRETDIETNKEPETKIARN